MQESKTGARRMGRDMRASLASFSSESNQLFCYIFVSAEVCINIAVTVKFNGVLMSWPGVHGVRRRDDGKAALLYFSSLHLCRISKLL